MSVRFKTAGTWRTVTQPWRKVNGTYRKATKVYFKVAGEWREAWPLQPGPVGALISSTTYRNDRIEIDVDWTEPTTGEIATKYIVTVQIGDAPGGPFAYTTTVEVTAPTTALTLTNSGNGFHTFAGKKVYVAVTAQSAAGRNSDSVSALPTTISQLPAPPAVTSYSVDVVSCAMYHTWAHAGGRRIDGVEINTQFNGVGATNVRYNVTTTTVGYQHWDPASIGGGTATGRIRTYGPGGTSAWTTVSGTMPSPVTVGTDAWAPEGTSGGGFRFGTGYIRIGTAGINPQVQVHTLGYPWDGVWRWNPLAATFNAGATEVYDPNSVNWARDWNPYGMLLRPFNPVNSWTGRDQFYGWARKMPNPVFFNPIDSDTWRGNGWRGSTTQDWQGYSSSGINTAYFFYGNQLYDWLRPEHVGYNIHISVADIVLYRDTSGGSGSAVSPRIIIHKAGDTNGDRTGAGGHDTTALGRGAAVWCPFPWEWAWYMALRHEGYRGLGLYHPNTAINASLGVSNEYMIMKAWNFTTFDAGTHYVDCIRIHHYG